MTRMWCVNPKLLCDQHLLGEHKELHQLVGTIQADRINVVEGHAKQGQVDTALVEHRHGLLVREMTRRGMNHQSPLEYDDTLRMGHVDPQTSLRDLCARCENCRERIHDAEMQMGGPLYADDLRSDDSGSRFQLQQPQCEDVAWISAGRDDVMEVEP